MKKIHSILVAAFALFAWANVSPVFATPVANLSGAKLYSVGGWYSLPNATYQQQPIFRLYAISGSSPQGAILNPAGGLNVPLDYGTHVFTFIGDSSANSNISATRTLDLIFDGPVGYNFAGEMGATSITLTTTGSNSGSFVTADGMTTITASQFTFIDGLQNPSFNRVSPDSASPGNDPDSQGTVVITLTPNIAAYQARIATLQAQLQACDDLVASLQQQLGAANALVSSLTSANGALSTQLAAANALNGQLTTANQTLQATANSQATQIASLNAQVQTLNANLAAASALNAQLSTANQTLQSTVTSQSTQIASLSAQVQTLTGNLSTANTTIANLQTQLASAQASNTTLGTSLGTLFNNPTFKLPGATPAQQIANLVTAIQSLNHGQKQALYENLGGKKK